MGGIAFPRLRRVGVAFICTLATTLPGACAVDDSMTPSVSNPSSDGVFATTTLDVNPSPRPSRLFQQPLLVKFISPRGDPACFPCKPDDGPNEYVFDGGTPAKVSMTLRASVLGTGGLKGASKDFRFVIPNIDGTTIVWPQKYADGVPEVRDGDLYAEVTLEGLPPHNAQFGRKTVVLTYLDRALKSQAFELFYPGTASNGGSVAGETDQGQTEPNWFRYYKENAGGGEYRYNTDTGESRSITHWSAEKGIFINDEAYTGHSHFCTRLRDDGELEILHGSRDAKFYAGFIAALAHEHYHAEHWNEEHGPTASFEIRARNKGRNLWKEGDDKLMTDVEFYANGPTEQQAIERVDTSADWASPGTNFRGAIEGRSPAEWPAPLIAWPPPCRNQPPPPDPAPQTSLRPPG